MSIGSEGRHSSIFDPDMTLPPAVLHFFPVVLALFTLTLSVAGHSIFFGCDEDEPITWMSLTLMLAVLLTLLAVIRDSTLEPFKRRAAAVLSAVTGFAILDENLRWHEKFGKYVKNELDFFTRDVRHYTDDVVVVLFALAGALLFFLFVRKLPNRRDYIPYIACAVALALAHGLLDVLGHGGRLWRVLTPGITENQIDLLTETLGFYEECCKLWAEWFVLLFVLRFLHGQKGPLAWSMLVMAGSFLAGIGLWAIENPSVGVPYVLMERTLRLLRNYHLLIALTSIFSIWALVSWRLFGEQPRKQALAGLFFLAPFYAVLPEIAQAGIGVASNPGFGLFDFSLAKLPGQPWLLLSIGGVLFPWALKLLFSQRQEGRKVAFIVVIALAAALLSNPLWLLIAFAVTLALAIQRQTVAVSKRTWSVSGWAPGGRHRGGVLLFDVWDLAGGSFRGPGDRLVRTRDPSDRSRLLQERGVNGLVAIPVYNEAANLQTVIEALRGRVSPENLLFIDDGSSDGSHRLVEAAGLTLLRHPINLGYEEALRTGMSEVLRNEFEYVVCFAIATVNIKSTIFSRSLPPMRAKATIWSSAVAISVNRTPAGPCVRLARSSFRY